MASARTTFLAKLEKQGLLSRQEVKELKAGRLKDAGKTAKKLAKKFGTKTKTPLRQRFKAGVRKVRRGAAKAVRKLGAPKGRVKRKSNRK